MRTVVLTLGGVPFKDFEVPEKIEFGGGQRLAVHALIGGGQVVDALGDIEGEINFSGVFSGSDATDRVRTLDAARALGTELPLVWDSFFYTVVIAQFAVEYRKPTWIPFAIRCAVITDPVAALASLAAPVANLISQDLFSAVSLAPSAGLSLAGLSGASAAGFASAQAEIDANIATSGTSLGAAAATFSGAPDASTGVSAMGQLVTNSGTLAALAGLRGYVERAASNLSDEFI
jgi:hypothetical protein